MARVGPPQWPRLCALAGVISLVQCGSTKVTDVAAVTAPTPTQAAATTPALAPAEPGAASLKPAEICALPRTLVAQAVPGAHAFSRLDPPESPDPFDDRIARGPKGDTCFVADDNIARAERDSRGPASAVANASGVGRAAKPQYLDRVSAHLHLHDSELASLQANGFLALDRLEYESYATAYHDLFQEELPLYVSIDSVLNSVFQANGTILEHIEQQDLYPRLTRMLTRLRKTLSTSVSRYGSETTGDLDIYLGVAQRLFIGPYGSDGPRSLFQHDVEVDDLAGRATGGEPALENVSIFGRERMIDFTQLTPRGHYTQGQAGGQQALDTYFRAMQWLSRFEWNLVSRSCRSSQPGAVPNAEETPREARDAMALADLVSRAGELEDLAAFDRVYTVFAGKREDVSIPDLLRLMAKAGTTPAGGDAPDRLRAAIGAGFQRTTRVHFMPEGSTILPAIATLFGPRIVPDTAPLTRVVHDSVPQRFSLGAADVAFELGHDRALEYLKEDLATFPSLRGALMGGRDELLKGLVSKTDLYSLWLGAVVHLADRPHGTIPTHMRSRAYEDMAMNSAIVGYGQIRHNYVLLAAQGYDSYGCEIPDGYVEPALGTYDALLGYARAARKLDVKQNAYWDRVIEVLGMLRAIVVTELSGARLSEAQRRWLGMVVEYVPIGGYAGGDSHAPPKWTGWYFDLFPDRHHGAERIPAYIADYFTLTNAGRVAYVGAERPRLGVFIIDVNGEPRAMVGPVAKGYELLGPIAERLDDAKATKATGKTAPWLSSYLAPDVPVPDLEFREAACDPDEERVVLSSEHSLGDVTVTLLDHHGDPVTASITAPVGRAVALFTFRLPPELKKAGVEGMHVWVHDLATAGLGRGRADLMYGVRVYSEWHDYFMGGDEIPPTHPFQPFAPPGAPHLDLPGEPF
jgi:hypothetical protein